MNKVAHLVKLSMAVLEDWRRSKEELDVFEKRARAEDILINAQGTNAPPKLQVFSVEDFLAKRAELENASNERLEKIATLIEFCEENNDGFDLSDEIDDATVGDLNSWLRSQI